jgi:hypothetical protein
LGEEIKQHSNPFANLAQRGLRRAQTNALKAMVPDLQPTENPFPRSSIDLGDSYVLLRAMDNVSRPVRLPEATAIRAYLQTHGIIALADHPGDIYVTRWARLRLPNGQISRSAWKEKLKPLSQTRMARQVKVSISLYILPLTHISYASFSTITSLHLRRCISTSVFMWATKCTLSHLSHCMARQIIGSSMHPQTRCGRAKSWATTVSPLLMSN